MKRVLIILFFTSSFFSINAQNINELVEYYSKGELDKAFEVSTALISVDEENRIYNQMHGRILTDIKKYAEAIPYLVRAIEIDDNKTDISAWAHGFLGQCYFSLGQYENSEKSLKKCIILNATKNSVKYANKRLFLFGFNDYFSDWKIIDTENIRFHIQFPKKIMDINAFIAEREKAFIEIQNNLGSTLLKKIDFFVWDNKSEPLEKFKIRLGFADPLNVCLYSHKNQTIGHEMTHVISHYIGKNPTKTGIINEGLAIYFNMRKDNKFKTLERTIKQGNYKNLKVMEFWMNWQNYSDKISYPLAGAFMEALIEKYGISKLKPLFINQSYENAKELLGDDLDKLISDFEKRIESV